MLYSRLQLALTGGLPFARDAALVKLGAFLSLDLLQRADEALDHLTAGSFYSRDEAMSTQHATLRAAGLPPFRLADFRLREALPVGGQLAGVQDFDVGPR